MESNVLEGIGSIILSIAMAIYWYKWRQNPDRYKRVFAYDLRALIVVLGFLVGGILLIMGKISW